MPVDLVGAVLAGGRSCRLGTDKAFVALDGVALAVRGARALEDAGASEVVVVGGDRPRVEAHGLAFIEDAFPGQGPVGGVLTALDVMSHASLTMILPCDLARPTAAAITATVEALAGRPTAACAVPDVGGRPQWLHSCWRRASARDGLFAAFASGARSFRDATIELEVITVRVDPDALVDIDTPEDLSRAEAPGAAGLEVRD